jgi:YD repeat-containing protein
MTLPYPNRLAGALLPIVLALGLSAAPVRADRTTSYTYTDQGQLSTIDGPRTDVTDITTYDYDDQGNRILVSNTLGHETYISTHDGAGWPLTIVEPNSLTTQLIYDPVGNLTQVEAPDGSVQTYEYDAANRIDYTFSICLMDY